MDTYTYSAINNEGKKVKGSIGAVSEQDLRQKIRDLDLIVIHYKLSNTVPVTKVYSCSMSPKQRSILFGTLSTLVSPDLQVDHALSIAAKQTKNKNIKKMIGNTISAIREGKSLSEALRAYPKSFPPLYIASIEASEESGKLNQVLLKLSEHSTTFHSNNQKIKLAMLYPSIMVTLSFLITGYLLGFVMPDIVDTYNNQKQALPLLTSVMMGASDILVKYWLYILLGISGVAVIYSTLVKKAVIRLKVDQIKLKTPGLRRIISTIESTNYVSTLSMLVNAGIPLSKAMSISSTAVLNKEVKNRLDTVLLEVGKGKTFSAQLRKANLIPAMMLYLIESGERSEQLGLMLEKAAKEQTKETNNITEAAIGLINPALLVVMGGIVLTIAMAILLPIMNMSSFLD